MASAHDDDFGARNLAALRAWRDENGLSMPDDEPPPPVNEWPAVVSGEYVFARESFTLALEEAKPLFEEHWKEVALYDDIALDPDYDIYHQLERMGSLHFYTVRHQSDGLVGYAMYVVRRHLHYKQSVWAISDIILVRKEHRNAGVGNNLLELAEKDLKSHGVVGVHSMTKVQHPALGRLLESRGHVKAEVNYSLRL